MMVFAAMTVPRFCSCFSHTRLQICFNVYKCICTQQSTLYQQLGERDLGKIHVLMSTKKANMAQCTRGRDTSLNEMLFSLTFLSHGCNFFL